MTSDCSQTCLNPFPGSHRASPPLSTLDSGLRVSLGCWDQGPFGNWYERLHPLQKKCAVHTPQTWHLTSGSSHAWAERSEVRETCLGKGLHVPLTWTQGQSVQLYSCALNGLLAGA